jgi:hypothetical protein
MEFSEDFRRDRLMPLLIQGQLSAANTAIANKAKLSGPWVDRSDRSEVAAANELKKEIEQLLHDRFVESGGGASRLAQEDIP